MKSTMTNTKLLFADTAQQRNKPHFSWHQLKWFLGYTIPVDSIGLNFTGATNTSVLLIVFFNLNYVCMRSGHALSLQTVQPSQPEGLTEQEEHPHCQSPCFSRHKLAENYYEHPQCQAEEVSKDVDTEVDVSGPLDSEDKTKVR